ncbi:hypothetical protein J3459_011435 [Metarhizium acridum]|uniref:uncharacterized protein n=1 Tax=Metarhizium acridum TaxID=92637 RepID=UPI001C6C75A9|nr:hypothetical protein J3458_009367 [Metarhizium acridum]KAG8420032.1 hypothetical protein J3459_011435 [Metarhizium acridum]
MTNITPFKIDVPDAAIKKLKAKLELSDLPDEVDFSNDWDYGAPRDDILRLTKYWRDGYDWRAHEGRLNADLPQFKTTIDVDGFGSLNVHFVHKKSPRPGSIPLLFCHGWPGHFAEVAKILPLLTDANDGPSFHVVAPSLPNFGFSGGVRKKGFSIPQYAEALHKVMLSLGYNKYVTQGGDWGCIITRLIGVQYPSSCLASHVNFVHAQNPPGLSKSPVLYLQHKLTPYTDVEAAFLERTKWFQTEGFGYFVEQSTRPSTIGIALADPVALLAWVYEKLHDWTDNYPWTDDEILTWVSIYQFSTAGAAASVRIYYESKHAELARVERGFGYVPNVPLGLSYFPKDLILRPRTWGRALGPVVFESVHADGGHFAAHERPEALVADLKACLRGARSMLPSGLCRLTAGRAGIVERF